MIKKGLKVFVLTGKDKKKEGEVIEIDRKNNRAKIKDINMVKKHIKTTKEKKGGIVSKENFIHISNLKLINEFEHNFILLSNGRLISSDFSHEEKNKVLIGNFNYKKEKKLDKKNPLNNISTSLNSNEFKNKSIVVVDDVLNSGSTLMYAVKHFLDTELRQLKTTVLVDRNHKKFPIKVDFKGVSLSTSIQNHVKVKFDKNSIEAFLL